MAPYSYQGTVVLNFRCDGKCHSASILLFCWYSKPSPIEGFLHWISQTCTCTPQAEDWIAKAEEQILFFFLLCILFLYTLKQNYVTVYLCSLCSLSASLLITPCEQILLFARELKGWIHNFSITVIQSLTQRDNLADLALKALLCCDFSLDFKTVQAANTIFIPSNPLMNYCFKNYKASK